MNDHGTQVTVRQWLCHGSDNWTCVGRHSTLSVLPAVHACQQVPAVVCLRRTQSPIRITTAPQRKWNIISAVVIQFSNAIIFFIIIEVPDIDSITLNPSANINYASYKSVYGFISVMSDMIDAYLVKKAADSPVITALKDESTDIVVNHRLAINIYMHCLIHSTCSHRHIS